MIATPTSAIPVPSPQRPGTENLFRRLDSDGNGRLTVADRASVVISLSPLSLARYALAANQGTQATRLAADWTESQPRPLARMGLDPAARYLPLQ